MTKKISIQGDCSLDLIVNMLTTARERGESMECTFWGKELSSETVTMDSAYKTVYGYTKEQYDRLERAQAEEWARQDREMRKDIPDWIVRGQALMYPEKYDSWAKWVDENTTISYRGEDIKLALQVMEALAQGVSTEEATKILKSHENFHRIEPYVLQILLYFSNVGPEFCEEYITQETGHEPVDKEKEMIETQKKQNEELKKIHAPKTDGNGK